MQAYVLLKCIPGYEKDIIAQLKTTPEVQEVNGILGKYDIFLKISSMDPLIIDKTIEKIRSIPQITETDTMSVIYGQGGTIDG